MTTFPHLELHRLRQLATLMDGRFRIPGLGVRFGLDGILGLVPVVGDALALAPALLILRHAHAAGADRALLVRMGTRTAGDFLLGSIPLVGDLFDVAFRANTRNVDDLERFLAKRGELDPREVTAKVVGTSEQTRPLPDRVP